MLQRTIKDKILIEGVGLHSGAQVKCGIFPAEPDQGVRFVRTDLEGDPEIPATVFSLVDTQLATTLGLGSDSPVRISTVEHILSALSAAGIDNVRVHVDGPELPILDGSSKIFFEKLTEVGAQTQLKARKLIRIKKKIEIKHNGRWGYVEPSNQYEIFATIDWDHPAIGYQEYRYQKGTTSYLDIAGARTFGILRHVEEMRKMGLARGGSLDNAIVLDDAKVINKEGLRYPDEFVRHKVLDAIGDFALAGLPILGRFRLYRSGHELHNELIRTVLASQENYEILEARPISERADSLESLAEVAAV